MSKINQYSPERLADRAEIQDLLFKWSRAIDRLDFDAIRDVFHADAIDHHGAYDGGVDGLIEWIRNRHKKIPFSKHLIGNMLIEFSDADNAVVETYSMTIQRYTVEGRASLTALLGDISLSDAPATDTVTLSRYVDHVSRRDGEWRIQVRNVVYDNLMIVDAGSANAFSQPGFDLGQRNQSDRVFEVRRSLGI